MNKLRMNSTEAQDMREIEQGSGVLDALERAFG